MRSAPGLDFARPSVTSALASLTAPLIALFAFQPPGQEGEQQLESGGVDHQPESIAASQIVSRRPSIQLWDITGSAPIASRHESGPVEGVRADALRAPKVQHGEACLADGIG